METEYITLSHNRAKTVIHAVQGESKARSFVFSLISASGELVRFQTDHKAFFYIEDWAQFPAMIDTTNNTVTVKLTAQATARAGNHVCTLQVFDATEDIWRGNMVLSVENNPALNIPEKMEFVLLTQILQNAEAIGRLLDKAQITDEICSDTLSKYVEGLSPEKSGIIDQPDPGAGMSNASDVAYDLNGDLLWLDAHSRGAANTKLSLDNGRTWLDADLSAVPNAENEIFHMAIGGDKFLLLGSEKAMWVNVQGNSLVPVQIFDSPIHTNTFPPFLGGRYTNGKYWVFRVSGSSTFPPVYFTGESSCSTVNLPDPKMEAHDIAYDAVNGIYYMVGGYDAFGDDTGKGWVLQSGDLVNWTTIKTWDNVAYSTYKASVIGEVLVIYAKESGGFKVRIRDKDTWTEKTVQVATGFDLADVAASPYGNIIAGSTAFVFTKNGIDFDIYPVVFPEKADERFVAASFGRWAVIANGPHYVIYRVDLAGESMIRSLEAAKIKYEELEKELEAAAGRRIVCLDTDPGQGAAREEPDGTIIFVFKEEEGE